MALIFQISTLFPKVIKENYKGLAMGGNVVNKNIQHDKGLLVNIDDLT